MSDRKNSAARSQESGAKTAPKELEAECDIRDVLEALQSGGHLEHVTLERNCEGDWVSALMEQMASVADYSRYDLSDPDSIMALKRALVRLSGTGMLWHNQLGKESE